MKDIFDIETYALFTSMTRKIGKEAAEEVARSAGLIAYNIIKEELELRSGKPLQVIRSIADYLVRSGYANRIEVEEKAAGEIIYSMYDVTIFESAKRLNDEGAALPHYATHIMFAALKELCGVEPEITELEMGSENEPGLSGRERWILHSRG